VAALVVLLVLAAGAGSAQANEMHVQGFFSEGRERTFEVPAGVSTMTVVAQGGAGFGGGLPAEVSGNISVHGGEILYIEVGGDGTSGSGGFNGGGPGGEEGAGGGGGASDVRTAPRSAGLSPDTRLIVAGGSGGSGSGGAKGGAAGAPGGSTARLTGGGAGTQSAGGETGNGTACTFNTTERNAIVDRPPTPGALEWGGEGAECKRRGAERFPAARGGGGGGGFYGGGGGAVWYHIGCINGCPAEFEASGGGGGSSLVPAGGTLLPAGEGSAPTIFLHWEQPQNPPVVKTGASSGVTAVHATVDGVVNPEFHTATCEFEYGPSEEYGAAAPCPGTVPATHEGVAVSVPLTELAPGTTYHYRVVATTEEGTSYGEDQQFTTRAHEPPTITGFTPKVGPDGGGTTVTVTGTGFENVTKVFLDETEVKELQDLSPTTLSFVTPETFAGEHSVVLLDDIGDRVSSGSEAFKTQSRPVLLSASSKKGAPEGGFPIFLKGEHLDNAEEVLIGSTAVPVKPINKGEASFVTPPMTVGKYFVRVVTPGGTSAETKRATYQVKGLAVSGLSPASGPLAGGTRVTVTGAGFAPGTGTSFLFKSTPGTGAECTSTTECTVTAPAGVKAVAVDVRALVGTAKSKKSGADRFTYE
jgi:hypothetical protein